MGDEHFGADRFVVLKERIGPAVKTVQKLSAAAKAAFGYSKDPQKSRGGKGCVAKYCGIPYICHNAIYNSAQGGGILYAPMGLRLVDAYARSEPQTAKSIKHSPSLTTHPLTREDTD